MARMLRRRRPLWKKRRPARKGRRAYKKSPAQGRLFVVRKVQELHTAYDSTFNTYVVKESGQNSITLGTPVAVTGVNSCYDVPFSIQFRLDELTNVADFSNLFDRYRITSAKVKVQSTLTAGTQTATPVPFIDYVTDHDDSTVPSISLMREKMGVKTKYFTASKPAIAMGCKPVPASLIYNSGAFNAYGVPKKSPFINMTNTGVPHYSIKGIIRNVFWTTTNNASPLSWDISYGVVCKDIQ